MFNNEGLYLYDIGKEKPCDVRVISLEFTIDAFNNLIVCDTWNERLHLLSLDGNFVYSFNIKEIEFPPLSLLLKISYWFTMAENIKSMFCSRK